MVDCLLKREIKLQKIFGSGSFTHAFVFDFSAESTNTMSRESLQSFLASLSRRSRAIASSLQTLQNSHANPVISPEMQQFHDSLKEYSNNVSPMKLLSMGIVDPETGAISSVSNNINNNSNTHNINNDISCILKGDKSIYCTTQKRNVNILFKFTESRSCVFTNIIIKLPENPSR